MNDPINSANKPNPDSAAQNQSSIGHPHLFGMHGEYARQIIDIPSTGLHIGRGKNNQVRLREISVSRTHAAVLLSKDGFYIRDQDSSLGTMVNGRRISGPTKLNPGDIIRIGYGQAFEFRAG
jgi:pSer/pThr/pTyr-binding forkhead associated (FHA) protein